MDSGYRYMIYCECFHDDEYPLDVLLNDFFKEIDEDSILDLTFFEHRCYIVYKK
jgi:hypothetical protein